MSVKRQDLIRYMEDNGFTLVREGAKHAIYSDGTRTVPVKRQKTLDRITANQLCKQAGLPPRY